MTIGEHFGNPAIVIEFEDYQRGVRGGVWKLIINNLTIAYGTKGKMRAIAKSLTNDCRIPSHYTLPTPEVIHEVPAVPPIGTTKTVVEMDYSELEQLVKETYGVAYEYPCSEELNNGTSKSYDYKSKKPLDEYDTKRLAEFKTSKGDSMMIAHVLFQDMVNNDVLAPAEYLVEVYW